MTYATPAARIDPVPSAARAQLRLERRINSVKEVERAFTSASAAIQPMTTPTVTNGPTGATLAHTRKSALSTSVARVAEMRVDLDRFRKGWLLPAGWDIAHWFDRTPKGWSTACGKQIGKFYTTTADGEIAYRPGDHPTCRRCAAAMR